MFSFKLPNAGQKPAASNSQPAGQGRSFTSPGLGQTFMDAIRRIASQATRFFNSEIAPHTQATRAMRQPELKRADNTGAKQTSHTMREVQFASSPRLGKQAVFPNQVEYRFTASGRASRGTPGISALLPELAKSIQNKQGFVYLYDDKSTSPMAKFVNDFQNMDSLELGNGCRIVGAKQRPFIRPSGHCKYTTLCLKPRLKYP
jgi:hypothetical protein